MKLGIALPRENFDARCAERVTLRNPRQLWERTCACEDHGHAEHVNRACGKNMKTVFAPDRSEKVYCKECFDSTVN